MSSSDPCWESGSSPTTGVLLTLGGHLLRSRGVRELLRRTEVMVIIPFLLASSLHLCSWHRTGEVVEGQIVKNQCKEIQDPNPTQLRGVLSPVQPLALTQVPVPVNSCFSEAVGHAPFHPLNKFFV